MKLRRKAALKDDDNTELMTIINQINKGMLCTRRWTHKADCNTMMIWFWWLKATIFQLFWTLSNLEKAKLKTVLFLP